MRKMYVVLAFILLICSVPITAFANGPGPSPYNNYLLIDDYTNIISAEIWGYDKDNHYKLIEEVKYPQDTWVPNQKLEYFYNNNGSYVNFQLLVTFDNGDSAKTNFVDIVEWGSYIYSVKDNTLKEGEITTEKTLPSVVFRLVQYFVYALLFTVIIEWIISLFFGIKPGRYIVKINILTNVILNFILLFTYTSSAYYFTVAILEILVVGSEFWFYTYKYKLYSKKKLLLYSVSANATSWGLYWLLYKLIGL